MGRWTRSNAAAFDVIDDRSDVFSDIGSSTQAKKNPLADLKERLNALSLGDCTKLAEEIEGEGDKDFPSA